jgi:hypothetical protein
MLGLLGTLIFFELFLVLLALVLGGGGDRRLELPSAPLFGFCDGSKLFNHRLSSFDFFLLLELFGSFSLLLR